MELRKSLHIIYIINTYIVTIYSIVGLRMTEGSGGEFVVVSDGPEPITDIKVLSKKENKQPEFEVVRIAWACH